ncbi:hypothetical protein [Thalassotalea fusca]
MNTMIKVTIAVLGIATFSNANSTNVVSSNTSKQNNSSKSVEQKANSGSKLLEDFQTYLQQTMGPNMRPGVKNPRCTPYPECVIYGTGDKGGND